MKKLLVLLTVLFSLRAFPAAADNQKALTFMKNAIDEVIEKVIKTSAPRKERIALFDKFFRENADLEAIGKFALAKYWRPLSEKERQNFINTFTENVVVTWERRFEEYQGQTFQFTGTRESAESGDTFVDSNMVEEGQKPIAIVWRVRSKGGSLKLVDIVIEGVSMLQVYRKEYTSVLAQNNGDIKVLIKKLKENTKQAEVGRK